MHTHTKNKPTKKPDLGEHDGNLGDVGRHVLGGSELGDEGHGSVGQPGQEVGDDDGHGDLGRLHLRLLGSLPLANLRVELLGHLAHLLLVGGHGAVYKVVAIHDGRQGQDEAADVQAHDVGSVER